MNLNFMRLRRPKLLGFSTRGCFDHIGFGDKIFIKSDICCWLRVMAKNSGHWSQGLLASMNDTNAVVDSDDTVVIIKDKYPKVRLYKKRKISLSDPDVCPALSQPEH